MIGDDRTSGKAFKIDDALFETVWRIYRCRRIGVRRLFRSGECKLVQTNKFASIPINPERDAVTRVDVDTFQNEVLERTIIRAGTIVVVIQIDRTNRLAVDADCDHRLAVAFVLRADSNVVRAAIAGKVSKDIAFATRIIQTD